MTAKKRSRATQKARGAKSKRSRTVKKTKSARAKSTRAATKSKVVGKAITHNGHVIRILEQRDTAELWIDETPRRYFETDDGFTLYDDAYAPPAKTLLEAAKQYCERI